MSVISVTASVPTTGWPSLSCVRLIWSETKRTVIEATVPAQLRVLDGGAVDGVDGADLGLAGGLPRGDRLLEGAICVLGQQAAQCRAVAGGERGHDDPECLFRAIEEGGRVEAAVDRVASAPASARPRRSIPARCGQRPVPAARPGHRSPARRRSGPAGGWNGGAWRSNPVRRPRMLRSRSTRKAAIIPNRIRSIGKLLPAPIIALLRPTDKGALPHTQIILVLARPGCRPGNRPVLAPP